MKNRWLHKDCEKDMVDKAGSVSQYQAPTAVQMLTTISITGKKN